MDRREEHPSAAFLIVEVADSSLKKDRNVKAELYAENGVSEFWIVNLVDRVVEVHRDPANGRYTTIQRVAHNSSIALVAFSDVTIRVADFLP